jgi:putative Holliday junction resolvase
VVSPLAVLEIPRGDDLVEAIAEHVAEHGPDVLVVGLPLNMDGTEGDRAKICRAFGEQIAARCGLPVHYQDERLTSDAANHALARSGRTHKQKKAVRDALAAVEILRDFLASA